MLSENNIIWLKQVIQTMMQRPRHCWSPSQEKPGSPQRSEDIFGIAAQHCFSDDSPADQRGWVPVAKIILFPLLLGSRVERISQAPLQADGSCDWAPPMASGWKCWMSLPSLGPENLLSTCWHPHYRRSSRELWYHRRSWSHKIPWFIFIYSFIMAVSYHKEYSLDEPCLTTPGSKVIGPRVSSSLLLGQLPISGCWPLKLRA